MSTPGRQRTGETDSRGPCGPVVVEYGAALELAGDPDYDAVHEEIADQLIATYPHVKDIEARLCGKCALASFCRPRQVLIERKALTEAVVERRRFVELLTAAPRWLAQALTQRAGMTSAELAEIAKDEASFAAAVDAGFSVREFTSGVDIKLGGRYFKDQLPELKRLGGVYAIAEFQEVILTRKDGVVFSVLECPDGVAVTNFGGETLNISMYRLLMHKMFKTMTDDADGATGGAPILNPNGVTQSLLRNRLVFECRKKGSKDRAYYTLRRGAGTTDDPHRVVLLGGSSGNDDTQEDYINSFFK